MAILDFWTTNLNPITMLPTILEHKYQSVKIVQKKVSDREYTSIDLSNDPDYISAKEAISALGVGAKKIKQAILDNGLEYVVYMSRGVSFYKRCNIDSIEIEKPVVENMDEYISGTELRELNNWSYWNLWNQAAKNKWKKKKFSGNMTWYLRSEVLKKC